MRTLLSRRRELFHHLVHEAYKLEVPELISRIRDGASFGLVTRAAALRVLIGKAPIEVTKGAVYLQRRAFVRKHYNV